jgi:hypothetical protein
MPDLNAQSRLLEGFSIDTLQLSHYRAAILVAFFRDLRTSPITPEKNR